MSCNIKHDISNLEIKYHPFPKIKEYFTLETIWKYYSLNQNVYKVNSTENVYFIPQKIDQYDDLTGIVKTERQGNWSNTVLV